MNFSSEDIISDLVSLNLEGKQDAALKVIHVFPAKEKSAYTSCVIEVSHSTWASLKSEKRIYIGHSACRFADHVRILQCYKCLSFGHQAKDCKSQAHCGHCAGDHEMKSCPTKKNQDTHPKCFNCQRAKLGDVKHTALDGKKCPLLANKLKDKISRTNYG